MLSRLFLSDTALFVCDVQNCFLKTIFGVDDVIQTTKFLLQSARALDLPCIVTEQYPEKLQHTGSLSSWVLCSSGCTTAVYSGV